ncbi:immunoglobulin-like domain-containing protein [Enterococcus sp. DIV0800]|uniref:immunoglobulin-like domain-containing protein n=1 Tax=unclassified Enterococcus TaxID=2608891 RepID=UPI003D2FE4C4
MNAVKKGMIFSIGLLLSLTFLRFTTPDGSSDASAKDMIPPKIEQISDCTLTLQEAKHFDPLKNVQSFDNVDGNLTEKIKLNSNMKKDTIGKYELIYSVADSSGNKTSKKRTVTIVPDKEVTTSDEPASVETEPVVTDIQTTEDTTDISESAEPISDIAPIENESAPVEVRNDPTPESEPVMTQQHSTINFLGVTIPFVNCNGASAAPNSGAGTWTGTGMVNDNAPTHFIGHNPGDFAPVMNITVGTPITIVDGQGNTRTYTVYEVLDVNDDGINAHDPNDDTWARVIDAGGERISLQTCITDSMNRIVLAR